MRIITSILATVMAISLQAESVEIACELTKITDLKNDLYIKKVEAKRDLISENRDTRELIRDYKALKIYAGLRK